MLREPWRSWLRREWVPCAVGGCGARAAELDHITPLAAGGTHNPANLQPLCRRCHKRKTNADRGVAADNEATTTAVAEYDADLGLPP